MLHNYSPFNGKTNQRKGSELKRAANRAAIVADYFNYSPAAGKSLLAALKSVLLQTTQTEECYKTSQSFNVSSKITLLLSYGAHFI